MKRFTIFLKNFFTNIFDVIFGITPNKDLKRAIALTSEIINKAKKEVKIVSGCLSNDFYQDKRITDALKNAAEVHKVNIEIICGPEIDNKSLNILILAKDGDIKLYKTKQYPEKHFTIVDEKYVRAEVSHKADKIIETKAYILRNPIFLAKKLEIEFNELKKNASLVGSV